MSRWTPELTNDSSRKDDLINMYRAHQLYHSYANSEAKHLLCLVVITVCCVMISILYTLIGFCHLLNPVFIPVLASILLITIGITKFCMDAAHDITDLSERFKKSFLDNDMQLTAGQKRMLRASNKLRLDVGEFTSITKETFPFIMSQIVVAKVVDLLLL